MNAGGRYGQAGEMIEQVTLIRSDGAVETRPARACEFAYRHSNLMDVVIIETEFEFASGDAEALLHEHQRIWKEKHAEQPPMSLRSAGCIFKNPAGDAAGRLVDACGLKGHRIGGAEISPRHANFILAHPDARASDVIHLAQHAKERVLTQFGIELEFEVEIW
jgi:UDP-N-acetylmuramate dehydrogenase